MHESMAALVGGALLSSFCNVVFDRIASREVVDFFHGRKVVAALLFELKARLAMANKLLSDAEERQLRDQNVKKWLDDLRDAVYDADHVLDKINTDTLRRQIEDGGLSGRNRPSKFLNLTSYLATIAFENSIRFQIAEIHRKLKILLDQSSFLGLSELNRSAVSSERLLAPLVEESDVCGRIVEKEAIVELLLSDNVGAGDKISVIPIVGMGGIGKTTLARLVYNDAEVQEYFDLRAWIIVSDNFDVARIAKTFLEMVTEIKAFSDDPNKLQSDLKNALKGKKFLFVLDDVWSENYDLWDVLRSSFESGEQGSKIIVTTRSKIVASNMGNVPDYDLQVISDEDCLSLFSKHVGFNTVDAGPHSDLMRIGVEIVKKCKGLPLAVKSIAGLLRSVFHPDEWRRILQSDIWELKNTNILPALWLSYQFLPPNLKRCFAYFSMFPKDYEFDQGEREKIILLWMAEGLLQNEKGKTMEDIGRDNLNALISRSFFQRSSRNESTLLMHDLLHDLAICISGEFSFKHDQNTDGLDDVQRKTRHLVYQKVSQDHSVEFNGLSDAKHLRTFLALPLSSTVSSSVQPMHAQKAMDDLRSGGGRLRVLSLSGSSVTELQNTFGDLMYLRFLDLSCTKLVSLPDSVCVLYNLQTLLLSNCQKLKKLPVNICHLISLRHLDVRGTPLDEMPPSMDQLKKLRMLSDFVLGQNDGARMKELGDLSVLHGSLRISGLENVVDFWDVSNANLKTKESLGELVLSWEGETDDSRKEREVLSELRPHANLKQLEINGFRGTTFPNWVGNQSSRDMNRVILSRCSNCVMLPPLGNLPSLAELRIQEMDGLVSVGDEFSGASPSAPFPSLERLTFDGMSMWKEWSFASSAAHFPSLTHLHLEFCRRLTVGLPAGIFPSLKSVKIVNCRSMETVFSTNTESPSLDSEFPSLESIQIHRCPRLESFSATGLPSSLKRLEIHGDCEALFANRMWWGLWRLPDLRRVELSGFKRAVDSFPEEGLLPSALARLRVDSFRNLRSLNGGGFRHLTGLEQLSICECDRLRNLPEEGLPRSLRYLRMVRCPLLSQRCRRNVGQDWHKISHIPVIIVNREEI